MLKKNFQLYMDKCEKLCKQFNVELDDFPDMVEMKKRNSVTYFVRKYINKQSNDKEYISLEKIEELF